MFRSEREHQSERAFQSRSQLFFSCPCPFPDYMHDWADVRRGAIVSLL